MFCSKCGIQISPNNSFCLNCNPPYSNSSQATLKSEVIKSVIIDAFNAFKILASDPIGRLACTFETIGPSKAFGVGLVYGVFISLSILFGLYVFYGSTIDFKLLILTVSPFVGLSLGIFISRKIFHGVGSLAHDVFISGSSLLPLAIPALVFKFLGFGNIDFICLLGVFTSCLSVLMIYAGFTRIIKLTDQMAAIATPGSLVVSFLMIKCFFML